MAIKRCKHCKNEFIPKKNALFQLFCNYKCRMLFYHYRDYYKNKRLQIKNNEIFIPYHKIIKWEIDKNGCYNCISHQKNINGYPIIGSPQTGRHKISRVLWTRFRYKIPQGMQINHKCDNPNCINLEHLYCGTAKDNIHDCILRGRRKTSSKLSKEQVISIYKEEGVQRKIAEKYNVAQTMVSAIKLKRCYKQLLEGL